MGGGIKYKNSRTDALCFRLVRLSVCVSRDCMGGSSPSCWGERGKTAISGQRRGSEVGSLERGSQPSPHQLRGLGERCKLPNGVWAEPRSLKGFLAF